MITVVTPNFDLSDLAKEIEKVVGKIPEIVNEAAIEAKELVEERITERGEATNGSALMTKSQNPIGRYGQRHGKARGKRGLQTGYVDLTFTGKMMSEFTTEQDELQTGVGFSGEESREKATELQKIIYETPIFEPSVDELDTITDSISRKIYT